MLEKTSNIIPCFEYVYDGSFPRPKNPMHYFGKAYSIAQENNSIPPTLRDFGNKRILERKITKWSSYLGSYGMGGCGFFGLQLEKTYLYPSEWFVLLFWGAAEWLLLNNHWIEATPNHYHIQKPLFSDFSDAKWDHLTDKLVGANITELHVHPNSMKCYLNKSGETQLLELPADLTKLPLYGSSKPRKWFEGENLLDAWVVTEGLLMTRS